MSSKAEADQIHIDVAPMTRANIQSASVFETLVRPSDLPPAHQQSELLRIAKMGQETPAGELLRATPNRTGD